MMTSTNGYICFYNGAKIEVYARTSYEAQQKAIVELSIPKKQRHRLAVVLAEIGTGADAVQVTHHPTF
jgi:hypothetical protein